ncbi:MAG: deaminase domain-containing protein [Tenuifilaceae bacterium]|nr:deaminase domain-containing protein [Tenuifilaceae bacterium]
MNDGWSLSRTGHTTLDILGSVPVGGEVFDVINCGWYLLEGEGGEAALCIVSVLPIVDIALKGGKYSIKLLLNLSTSKAFKQLVKSLPAEQLAALSRIASTIDPTNAEHYLNTLEQIAGLAAEYPQHVAVLEQLAKAIPSPASLQRITERIKQLGESTTKLLDDLAKNPTFAIEFFAKAGDNPGLVESWKILSNGSTSLKSIDNINAVHAFRTANPQIADDAIQAAFDGLKASRKQPFINALGCCADNKNLIGSLKKSKLASVDEIKDALNKMRDYKTGKPQSGNLGYLEDNIPGVTLDKSKMWESVSLDRARNETHIFDAIEATGSSGTWLRITDSEYRMLNDLAKKLGGVKGKSFPDITGTLKIVSENPYCTSCQGVIQQFSDMFPNIEIKLIDGIR